MFVPTEAVRANNLFLNMPSPPPSESLFFNSPTEGSYSGPTEEVQHLLASAHQVTTLTPAVSSFLSTHRDLFFTVFRRQVEKISSRSQAFEDAHITVYDKTLLRLTQNGTNLDNPAAIEYYCEEFLGTNPERMPLELSQQILHQAVALPALLAQAVTGSHTQSTPSSIAKQEESPEKVIKKSLPEMEPKMQRLWDLYESAREEYLAKLDKNDDQTTRAAMFLRDTAENTITYLKDKSTDPRMMAELQTTYNRAKATVVTLKNGRRRKFDLGDAERVKGAPRRPRFVPPKPTNVHNTGVRSDNADNTGFRGNNGTGWNYAATEAVHSGGPIRGNRGRGHSGVSFGYSRAVDSYHPYDRPF